MAKEQLSGRALDLLTGTADGAQGGQMSYVFVWLPRRQFERIKARSTLHALSAPSAKMAELSGRLGAAKAAFDAAHRAVAAEAASAIHRQGQRERERAVSARWQHGWQVYVEEFDVLFAAANAAAAQERRNQRGYVGMAKDPADRDWRHRSGEGARWAEGGDNFNNQVLPRKYFTKLQALVAEMVEYLERVAHNTVARGSREYRGASFLPVERRWRAPLEALHEQLLKVRRWPAEYSPRLHIMAAVMQVTSGYELRDFLYDHCYKCGAHWHKAADGLCDAREDEVPAFTAAAPRGGGDDAGGGGGGGGGGVVGIELIQRGAQQARTWSGLGLGFG